MNDEDKIKNDFPTQVFTWFKSIDKKVDEVRGCLLGDEFHPKGLVEKHNEHGKRISRLERFMYLCIGGLTVINILIAFFK